MTFLVVSLVTAIVASIVLFRRWRKSEDRAAGLVRETAGALRAATKADEEAVRAMRALDAVPHGVVVWDEDGREVFRNAVARDLAGARHTDAIAEQVVVQLLQSALDGRPARRELDLFGPPRRTLTVSAAPLGNGGPAGAVAVIDDVSERRRLEAVRRDFVANMSHEIKTPVGALGVLAETIVAEDDPAVVRRLAERMTNEALRVGRIIDDLLALSRIEAEEHPAKDLVQLAAVVEEATERMRSLAEANGIAVDTSRVGRRHTVRGDRRLLTSAVANLLENACKYSDAGSSVDVWSTTDGTAVELNVRDRGIGIPTRDLERVFERFYRVDRARSRETGGTGLGLAIVRHVVSSHGGDVRVTSTEGSGSTFTLRLPAGPAPVVVTPNELPQEAESA